jgi:plasmid stabilization system protein ParE
MDIIWLPFAERVLDEIFQFYRFKSQIVARKMIADIKQATRPLAEFPEVGTVEQSLSDFPETFRYVLVRHIYKIIYFIEENHIYIADIWDCRREPASLVRRIRLK